MKTGDASGESMARPRWGVKDAAILAGAHFLFLLAFFAPAISTPDANSYFVQARLIATTGRTGFAPESPVQFVGPHWRPAADGLFHCTHAPGLSLILAPVFRFFGPTAALLVNPALCSLALLGLYLAAAPWLGSGWALIAAALMAFNSFANEHAHFGDAHTIEAVLLVWTLALLERSGVNRALGAGLLSGLMPVERYAEAAYLPALAMYAGSSARANVRRACAALLGMALPLAALLFRNLAVYGSFLRTGYAATGEQSRFGLLYFLRNAPAFLAMLIALGGGPVFLLGAPAIYLLCLGKSTRRRGLFFAGLVVPTTLLYASYYWRPDWQSMRFLIPTFYVYAIAGVWLLKIAADRFPRRSRIIVSTALVVTGLWGLPRSILTLAHLKRTNGALARATRLLESHVDSGSIVVSPNGLAQHLDFVGRWRLAAPRERSMPEFATQIWRWAGHSRRVFWIAKEDDAARYRAELPSGHRLERLAETRLVDGPFFMPEPPEPESERGSPPEPMGPNRVFDLTLDTTPFILFEWKRDAASR